MSKWSISANKKGLLVAVGFVFVTGIIVALTYRGRTSSIREVPLFIATMDTHANSMKDNVQIYHTVLLNRGAGMDPDSGRFTAPLTGLYR